MCASHRQHPAGRPPLSILPRGVRLIPPLASCAGTDQSCLVAAARHGNPVSAQVRTMGFPGRYIQGPQALRQLPQLLEELGARSIAVLADATVRRALGSRIDAALLSGARGGAMPPVWLDFRGECSAPIIADLAARAGECDTIVALGGGKTIDTGKGISRQR